MKVPQYRQEAVKDLQRFRSAATQVNKVELSTFIGQMIDAFSDRNIPSFTLPDNGEIVKFNTECEMTMDNFHMPFKTCFLEYKYTPDYYKDVPSNKYTIDAAVLLVEHHEQAKEMRITPFVKAKIDSSSPSFIPPYFAFRFIPQSKIGITKKGVRMESVYPDVFESKEIPRMSDEELKQTLSEFSDEVRAVVHFAMLSACSNVKPQKIFTPSKTAIDWAKEKRRAPPNDYWVLDVYMNNQDEEEPKSGERTGGHASPRFHVRRGHVRVLATGKSTWVRQTTVGNRELGVVDKDYRVRVG